MTTDRVRPANSLRVTRMPHILELDGLRAIAILAVFIGHTRLLPAFPGGSG